MKISQEEVKHVATLARLEITDQEIETMTDQLDTILQYVAKLEEVDTTDVPVTTHTQNVVNGFREDIVRPSLQRDASLSNAPEKDDASFIVPRII